MEWVLIKEGILYNEFITQYNKQHILNRHLKAVEGHCIYKITDKTPNYSKLIYLGVSENTEDYIGINENDIQENEVTEEEYQEWLNRPMENPETTEGE